MEQARKLFTLLTVLNLGNNGRELLGAKPKEVAQRNVSTIAAPVSQDLGLQGQGKGSLSGEQYPGEEAQCSAESTTAFRNWNSTPIETKGKLRGGHVLQEFQRRK